MKTGGDDVSDELEEKALPSQQSLSFNGIKEDLVTIFYKYQENLYLYNDNLFSISEQIAAILSAEYKINKKQYYKFIINKSNEQLFKEGLFYLDYLEKCKNAIIKENSKIEKIKYFLQKELAYPSELENSKKIDSSNNPNTYNFNLNADKLDSQTEKWFVKKIRNIIKGLPDIHLFRNGVNKNDSFYIEYFDSLDKVRKFFPDFILFNNKTKKVMIIETKGNANLGMDIDKNTKYKVDKMYEYIKIINGNNNNTLFGKAVPVLQKSDINMTLSNSIYQIECKDANGKFNFANKPQDLLRVLQEYLIDDGDVNNE